MYQYTILEPAQEGLFIVGKKNVSIHSQLPIDLWFEFTLWRFSSLQICNQPTFEVAIIVNVCKEKIQPPSNDHLCHQFSFDCNHKRLYLFPQCNCYSFMCKTLNTNMIQKHVNGSFCCFWASLYFSSFQFGWRGVSWNNRFLLPNDFATIDPLPQTSNSTQPVVALRDHLQQIFNRCVDGCTQGSGHAGLFGNPCRLSQYIRGTSHNDSTLKATNCASALRP